MQNTAQFDGNIHARTPTTRTLGCGLHRPLPTPASSLRALTTIGRHRSTFLFWSVLLRILCSLRTQAGENVNCLRYPTTGCRLFVHQQAGYTALRRGDNRFTCFLITCNFPATACFYTSRTIPSIHYRSRSRLLPQKQHQFSILHYSPIISDSIHHRQFYFPLSKH